MWKTPVPRAHGSDAPSSSRPRACCGLPFCCIRVTSACVSTMRLLAVDVGIGLDPSGTCRQPNSSLPESQRPCTSPLSRRRTGGIMRDVLWQEDFRTGGNRPYRASYRADGCQRTACAKRHRGMKDRSLGASPPPDSGKRLYCVHCSRIKVRRLLHRENVICVSCSCGIRPA